jgi:CRP-like cAMP-binding protein
MRQIKEVIRQMIPIAEKELETFVSFCEIKNYQKKEIISRPLTKISHTLFVNKGILRFFLTDARGNEHTTHFSRENEFTGDYSSLLLNKQSIYCIQALEDIEVVTIPLAAINWGYENIKFGDRLGRLIAESYFLFMDHRISNNYVKSPKERYDTITKMYPDIHNRASQHMIASYLGITPVHLSRLKRKM